MRGIKTIGTVAITATILSGCVATGPNFGGGGGPVPRTPTFAEGNWQQGTLASYVFGNGSFVGTATDTGNKVADGTYRYINANTIQISSFSAVQQKTIVANCLLINGSTMNCTADSGATFSLARV
ncbi:MAG: hypothetical protein AAF870_01340 [Pseudomonadota bacterium]